MFNPLLRYYIVLLFGIKKYYHYRDLPQYTIPGISNVCNLFSLTPIKISFHELSQF
jgi:hypothetical protein